MKNLLIISFLLLSCEKEPILKPEIPPDTIPVIQVDTTPICKRMGTASMTALNLTGSNITLQLNRYDTARIELPTGISHAWDSIPAGWIGMWIFTKFGTGVYLVRLDTCQCWEGSIRTYQKTIKILSK
jgi:hypothetical protein